jgi:hypothetical protein
MSRSCMGRIGWPRICLSDIGSDVAPVAEFAPASTRGLRHKARHKIQGPSYDSTSLWNTLSLTVTRRFMRGSERVWVKGVTAI